MKIAWTKDLAVRIVAVVLMLTGAVMLVAGGSGAIGFPLVAIGAALTALVEVEKRRHGTAH
jgi:hypothetical protein